MTAGNYVYLKFFYKVKVIVRDFAGNISIQSFGSRLINISATSAGNNSNSTYFFFSEIQYAAGFFIRIQDFFSKPFHCLRRFQFSFYADFHSAPFTERRRFQKRQTSGKTVIISIRIICIQRKMTRIQRNIIFYKRTDSFICMHGKSFAIIPQHSVMSKKQIRSFLCRYQCCRLTGINCKSRFFNLL